jgi:SAM-dependent methyltransferase
LHLVLCLVVCLPLRLDVVVAYLAANISNPLIAPFLLFLEAEVGAWLLAGRAPSFDWSLMRQTRVESLAGHVVVGAQVVGVVLASLFGALALGLSLGLRRGRVRTSPLQAAQSRTIQRYASCELGDRMYVAMKLELDPLTRELAAFDTPLGRVLDVGCGRGQFSLLLRELDLAQSIEGFDWDPRKVQVAEQAARGDARYSVGDVLDAELAERDTILLFDVLHYLEYSAQRELVERLAQSLCEGGHLSIREMDGHAGWASRIGQWFEKVATKSGYNRARQAPCFQPIRSLTEQLGSLGFDCSIRGRSGSLWSGPNVLVVARRRAPQDPPEPPYPPSI